MATIPCEDETKEEIDELQEELDEEYPYRVTQDLLVRELLDAYDIFQKVSDNYTEEQVKALATGQAQVTMDKDKENREGEGKGHKGVRVNEGNQDKQ